MKLVVVVEEEFLVMMVMCGLVEVSCLLFWVLWIFVEVFVIVVGIDVCVEVVVVILVFDVGCV